MCTVSFIPHQNNIFITSNRDESVHRALAVPPRIYQVKKQALLFPKDGESGGTWVTVCNNGNAGVLLNGALEKHQRKAAYKKSRGLVFLDLMATDDPVSAFERYDFDQVEPFSLILWKSGSLYVCRWNEEKAAIDPADPHLPCLWSSCTLYDAKSRAKRLENFQQWLAQRPVDKAEEVIRFHQTALYEAEAAPDYGTHIKTVSITSLHIGPKQASVVYTDRLQQKIYETVLPLKERLSVYEAV